LGYLLVRNSIPSLDRDGEKLYDTINGNPCRMADQKVPGKRSQRALYRDLSRLSQMEGNQ
jgi:hypothetical protein